jgi:hypothetical protein
LDLGAPELLCQGCRQATAAPLIRVRVGKPNTNYSSEY